jgi:hypothetical protein
MTSPKSANTDWIVCGNNGLPEKKRGPARLSPSFVERHAKGTLEVEFARGHTVQFEQKEQG